VPAPQRDPVVAGRFPLYIDNDLRGPVVQGLRNAGWDLVRGIDLLSQNAADELHFAKAAELGRVLVARDAGHIATARRWLAAQRPFRGLITWPQTANARTPAGAFVRAFEELALRVDDPFAFQRIHFLKAKL
jgi:hypothetical protein